MLRWVEKDLPLCDGMDVRGQSVTPLIMAKMSHSGLLLTSRMDNSRGTVGYYIEF